MTTEQNCIELCLREKVLPVCDAMKVNPARGIPVEQVLANLRAHHAARMIKRNE